LIQSFGNLKSFCFSGFWLVFARVFARGIGFELPGCFQEIAFAYDVVSFEDIPGFVPGHLHGDSSGTPARTRFRTAVPRRS